MSLETRIKAVVEAIGADIKGLVSSLSGKNQTLTVKDEGSVTVTNPSELNFTGSGVSASNSSGVVTVNIPGGGVGGAVENLTKEVHQVAHGLALYTVVAPDPSGWSASAGSWFEGCGLITQVVDADNFVVTFSGLIPFTSAEDYSVHVCTSSGALDDVTTTLTVGTVTGAVLGNFEEVLYAVSTSMAVLVTPTSAPAGSVSSRPVEIGSLGDADVEFWSQTDAGMVKAIATSEATLATHCTLHYDSVASSVILGRLDPTFAEYATYYPVTRTNIGITAADGTKVYLSATVAGGVTITPPAIRQVLGVVSSNMLALLPRPYRETVTVSVGTVAPSNPAEGDVWIDTN